MIKVGRLLCLAALLLTALVTAWIYSPGINGPALMDDRSSLQVIQSSSGEASELLDYTLADRSGPLGRTVSIASFTLEKYLLDDGTSGHKQVNIILHLINGVLLSALLLALLRPLAGSLAAPIAILSAAGWLLSPLLVSTVLYSVQRMAILSTTFMLGTLLTYVIARQAYLRQRLLASLIAAMAAPMLFLLALFSKENAIVVLAIIPLLEAYWFQDEWIIPPLRSMAKALCALLLSFCGFLLLLPWMAPDLLPSYASRPFDAIQRVSTEAQILADYLHQFFWPDILRMGIYHDDFPLAESVADASAAVAGWLIAIALSLAALRRPLLRYFAIGVFWFLLAHMVESSVLPLELYFEHRNYFPLTGVVAGMAGFTACIIYRWRQLAAPTMAFFCLGLLLLASRTSALVGAWSSPELLRLHHYVGHPESPRANLDMASTLASFGALEDALRYSRRAHDFNPAEHPGDLELRSLALACMANRSLKIEGELFDEVQPGLLFRSAVTSEIWVRDVQNGLCPAFDARAAAEQVWRKLRSDGYRVAASGYRSLALLEFNMERYEHALWYVERALQEKPDDGELLLMKLHFASLLRLDETRTSAWVQLQKMRRDGALNQIQVNTLELYQAPQTEQAETDD